MDVLQELAAAFPGVHFVPQPTRDLVPTCWAPADRAHEVVAHLKRSGYRMLYDLAAVDERLRADRAALPAHDFTVVYHLLSFDRNADVRIKVPLDDAHPSLATVTDIWPSANWYEREIFDMFGILFDGHPRLARLLMPTTWKGHPLRKDHPARATEMGTFHMTEARVEEEQDALRFHPEEWGLTRHDDGEDYMFLNLGPQHPGTHGVLRIVLQLRGEEIVDAIPQIGYHHRGAEKMGERQSWHTFIPYTDRVDYLGGVMNNLPYVLSVERLAGIEVPDRVKVIRIMLCELFRIASHLVWYGTFAQDVGALSPVFYMFTDRERVFGIIEAICGARMHPNWFRIGGVAEDLPKGWDRLVSDFVAYFKPRLREYDTLVMANAIFRARTRGIGGCTAGEAIDWGATGPVLRATGLEWDFRKKRPYSGYDQFQFDIPTGQHGDSYDRAVVHVEEIRQSVRIIEQCVSGMPEGPYKSAATLATPPLKERTMHDIETLITHFLGVSWGPVIPAGEALVHVEATKGDNGYYLTSDGNTIPYRVRIRTPSFPHMQMVPMLSRGRMIPDLLAILGSLDFVLADIDR
ncbi:MAG: NADH-quinone oxidoreductase subunit C/D [Acidobacteria bacterium]|nr:NADH-quinone oxidoreductase subunit C/D [Acidobacteriota bacterium]